HLAHRAVAAEGEDGIDTARGRQLAGHGGRGAGPRRGGRLGHPSRGRENRHELAEERLVAPPAGRRVVEERGAASRERSGRLGRGHPSLEERAARAGAERVAEVLVGAAGGDAAARGALEEPLLDEERLVEVLERPAVL